LTIISVNDNYIRKMPSSTRYSFGEVLGNNHGFATRERGVAGE
jgi:hypothetical protein